VIGSDPAGCVPKRAVSRPRSDLGHEVEDALIRADVTRMKELAAMGLREATGTDEGPSAPR
jgi:hypothetical protein